MLHTLENELLTVSIHPRLGASIVEFSAKLDGKIQPIMRPTPPETLTGASSSPFASFNLVPFSNRIPNGKFVYQDTQYQLKVNTPQGNAQHGDIRNRSHTVVSQDANHVLYELNTADHPEFNYPFALVYSSGYFLQGNTLRQTFEIENTSGQTMPAGFGAHPYFVRNFAGSGDVQVQFAAEGYYQTDSSLIPTQGMQPIPPEYDYHQFKHPEPHVDRVYGGYGGKTTLRYPNTPYSLHITSESIFSHMVMFTAPDNTLAIEPVTHATDAFNLHARGIKHVGFLQVKAGETVSGSICYTLLDIEKPF